MYDTSTAERGATCPICEQPACSLSHVYDRLVAPALNLSARVLCRVLVLTAVVIVFGLAMGWSW